MKCVQCQKEIIGAVATYNGKKYCATCYQSVIAQAAQYDRQITEVSQYLCSLFNYNEMPPDWDIQLRNLVKNEKKTLYGIKMTLWYVYEVEGTVRDPDYVFYNVRLNYEKAAEYVKKQREVNNYNKDVELTNTRNTVVISRPVNQSRKLGYDISDL